MMLLTNLKRGQSLIINLILAFFRRGKASANSKWGVTKAVMAGNYIISYSSQLLASLESDEVTKIISRIIEDLIYGELCQLESVNSNHEHRYKQYIKKTYLKTASLIANSAEAVAVLTDQPAHVQQAAFNFGKYLGIAFQIQDDRLDFLADSEQLGKVLYLTRQFK
jgi:decaprenyl-diphosphate synthase subunit 1